MGNVKDLKNTEALKKLKELGGNDKTCIMVTALNNRPQQARPMSSQGVDDEGNIWFISAKSSEKNKDIASDSEVQLYFANNNSYEYLSVYGHAEISVDRALIEEYWSPIAKAWFSEGKDDPEVTLIKVVPLDAYYWDTKNNKLVSLFKYMVNAITGNTNDDNGVEGYIEPPAQANTQAS